MTTISLNWVKRQIAESKGWNADHCINMLARVVVREYCKIHGLYHAMTSENGLTDIIDDMRQDVFLEGPKYFDRLRDGKIHLLEKHQYAYLNSPDDMGVVKSFEVWKIPTNLINDTIRVIENELERSNSDFFMNKPEIIDELRTITVHISAEHNSEDYHTWFSTCAFI